ncbi:transglutaminase [Rhodobacter veldkampii DSM 11550]|uniref:Transglutaminase family protein n=1 Tax=Phaeovulum veldkampii DSM 11550 TaxID=1185920 RepID=A0A2T4JAK3_9RHOB|nr:transglutaminase family protein [Phaeovulum veldkampii]MBK5947003.1 transglutaminase [Phaeovulum veldkampii DSM 11550]PTE14921.1 transglutaminase family protein [Phaeovulum veldkampii DSM 11550]TDQ55593.1 transglutaminase-like putative cysteine protease [Phaeovulum veldkampii DSM 11550]
MILNVSHTTTYNYDAPMRGAVQSLRLFPSRFDGQKVLDWRVEVEGGLCGGSFRDGAGDRVEGWSVRGPLTQVVVRVAGQVETADLAGLLRGHREQVPPMAYLCETLPTRAEPVLVDLARSVPVSADLLDLAHRLADAVGAAIVYRPGVTHAHTTAAEALTLGEGVCQDHAHALIACARVLDLPARYVSGYLSATSDGIAHEAAHAWAEIHVAGLGWVGFDAANGCCPDDRYIRLASGQDAREAAPIRGIAQGIGVERLDVAVAVDAAQQ